MTAVGIIGAGGHARSVINLLEQCGRTIAGIYDDSFNGTEEIIEGYSLLGTLASVPAGLPLVLAVGDNRKRENMYQRFKAAVVRENFVHPTATVSSRIRIGESNLIFARAVVNDAACIGSNGIINTGAIVEHECVVGDHTHVSIGSILAGRVTVGNRCFIGAGAVVIDSCSIFDDAVIGAGAVVISNIIDAGTYVGIPAKKVK